LMPQAERLMAATTAKKKDLAFMCRDFLQSRASIAGAG